MAFLAVIDEAGFQGGLNTGNDALVDVGFALLATGGLDVDVDQLLAVNDGYAQFFLLRGIEQHAFHVTLRGPEGPSCRAKQCARQT